CPPWSCTRPARATVRSPCPTSMPPTPNACASASAVPSTPKMTEPSPPAPVVADTAGAAPERRLHPMSWLFVLVAQLRQFIVPLLALLVFGQGDRNELWPLIG